MKLNIKRTLTLFAFVLFANTLSSATVKWLVKPTYDRIEVFSENVFSCFLNGKIQLYSTAGNPLLPYPCDSVTNFAEGYALVLDRGSDETRWKIKGLIAEDGLQFIEIQRGYYTMLYSFFSEGLLAVGNNEGNYGYLDKNGNEAIPCRYKKARPFIKGWATVQLEDDGRTLYINNKEQTLRINFHHGVINDGTSFNQNGEAVIIHYKTKDMAVINDKGEVVRKYKQPKGVEKFYRNYDRSFCENCEEITAPKNTMPQYDQGISTYTSGKLYGYKMSKTTIPAQFSFAGPFANNCAIVVQGNRFGIITLTEGNLTSRIKEGDDISINPYKKIPTLTYQLEIPKGLPSVQLKLDKGNGVMDNVKLTNNSYSFKPIINKSSRSCIIQAEVYSDGLLLLEDYIELNVQQNASPLTVGVPSSTSERANSKDIQTVKATVTNNSETNAPVVVAFSAAFQANSPNKFVNESIEDNLAPGETKEFTASILVKLFENVKVTVKASTSGKSKSSSATITLTPYDY